MYLRPSAHRPRPPPRGNRMHVLRPGCVPAPPPASVVAPAQLTSRVGGRVSSRLDGQVGGRAGQAGGEPGFPWPDCPRPSIRSGLHRAVLVLGRASASLCFHPAGHPRAVLPSGRVCAGVCFRPAGSPPRPASTGPYFHRGVLQLGLSVQFAGPQPSRVLTGCLRAPGWFRRGQVARRAMRPPGPPTRPRDARRGCPSRARAAASRPVLASIRQ